MNLLLELNAREIKDTGRVVLGNHEILFTPPIDENFWIFRVKVSDTQAIVGFPKFTTIGIGFAQEDDWNTNLPYTTDANKIFDHISHNKGDESIDDADCLTAIQMVQKAAADYKAGKYN